MIASALALGMAWLGVSVVVSLALGPVLARTWKGRRF